LGQDLLRRDVPIVTLLAVGLLVGGPDKVSYWAFFQPTCVTVEFDEHRREPVLLVR
jgi:hypothetical protein